jgi:hypothetical protein
MCKQSGGKKNRPAKKSAQKSWWSLRLEREEETTTSSEMNRVSPLLSLFFSLWASETNVNSPCGV